MFSYDQLNKQPTSAVPLNKRYKYPMADQQALNNQMYQTQQQQGYMQAGNYVQAGGALYQQQQQQPYSQSMIGQQPYSAAAGGSALGAYNPAMMAGYPGQSALQQQANYAGYNQQHYAQASPYQTALGQAQLSSAYGGQTQLPGQLNNPVGLTNQPAASMASNALNYQTAAAQQQSSAYLPNVQNTLNASLASQIPTSNPQSMMQTAGGYSMAGQYGQQAGMYGQQSTLSQQQQQLQQQYNASLQNQYQQQQQQNY